MSQLDYDDHQIIEVGVFNGVEGISNKLDRIIELLTPLKEAEIDQIVKKTEESCDLDRIENQ